MTRTGNVNEHEHFRDLRLPYLEGLLEPEERLRMERHLQECSECSRELQDMARWHAILSDEKEIYCPEPWEVFDAVRGPAPREGEVRKHASTCQSCSSELEAFADVSRRRDLPQELWQKMQNSGTRRATLDEKASWLPSLRDYFDRLSELVRMPAFGLATAVAAALLLVILLPWGEKGPVVGLSQERWQPSVLEHGLMGSKAPQGPLEGAASRQKAAIVLLFAGFSSPPDQQTIDALYDSLYPGADVRERFEMVSPGAVRDAVIREGINLTRREDLVNGLHKATGATRVLLLTVVGPSAPYTIRAELLDTTSGKVLTKKSVKNVQSEGLKDSLDELARDVLVGRAKDHT